MARQVDFVNVVLKITRNPNGTYSNGVASIQPCVTDPTAVKPIDRGPFCDFPVTTAYVGTDTLDVWLGKVLTDTKNAAQIPP